MPKFFLPVFVNEITTPDVVALCTFKASVRLFERAFLIGTIELMTGMMIPIESAWAAENQSGSAECATPRSPVPMAL